MAVAVFDAGPLIYLDAAGYLEVVRGMYDIIIPDAVANELERRPGAPGSVVPTLDGVHTKIPAPHFVRRVEDGSPIVDAGSGRSFPSPSNSAHWLS